jgi:hypothetical protein
MGGPARELWPDGEASHLSSTFATPLLSRVPAPALRSLLLASQPARGARPPNVRPEAPSRRRGVRAERSKPANRPCWRSLRRLGGAVGLRGPAQPRPGNSSFG